MTTTNLIARPKLLTYAQASAYLNIPRNTLYTWTREGRIPHVRLGERTVRFRADDLDRWIEASTQAPIVG